MKRGKSALTFGKCPKVAQEKPRNIINLREKPEGNEGVAAKTEECAVGSSDGRSSAGMSVSVTGPGCLKPRPTLPATRSELHATAIPTPLVSRIDNIRPSMKDMWKPRASERGMVSWMCHRMLSMRDKWKPRASERDMVSCKSHRRLSRRVVRKPRGSGRVMVSRIRHRTRPEMGKWKPSTLQR